MRKAITITFALSVLSLLAMSAKAQGYGIEIKGTAVTAGNAASIWTGSGEERGAITFDPTTRTLTLDNVKMLCSGYEEGISIKEDAPAVTILLKGDNVLTHELGRVSLEGEQVTITGKGGSLQVTAKGVACYIDYGCQLSVQGGCTVDVSGDYGITGGGYGRTSLTIDGTDGTVFKAKGRQMPSMSDLGDIKLLNCVIVEPFGAKVEGGRVIVGDDVTSQQVVIKHVSKDYDIKVNGIVVTPENAADILGDQTVSYKKKYATLTLTNSNIAANGVPAIEAHTPVYINLVGDNTLSSDGEAALLLGGETLLHGSGTLEVKAPAGTAIEVQGDLKIKGVSCTATGIKALHGATPEASLMIEGSHLTLDGSEGALYGFSKASLVKDYITSPQGAVLENGAVMLEGAVCKGKVVIDIPVDLPLFVAGAYVTTANCHDILGDGTISFDHEKKILKLNNFKYITEEMITGINVMQAMGDITLEIHGENEIVTPYMGLVFTSGGRIEGDGTLRIKAKSQAMVLNGTQVIIDKGPKLIISGDDSGIFGYLEYGGVISFNGADVTVEKGGIVNLFEILFEGCGVSTPEGAEIITKHDAALNKDFKSVGLDGEIYRDKIVVDVAGGVEDALTPTTYQAHVVAGVLYVRTDASQELTLFDLAGQICYTTETVAGEECRIDGLASGSYLLQVGADASKVLIP